MRALGLVVCLVLCQAAAAHAQLRTVVYASGFSAPIAFEQDPSDPAMYIARGDGGGSGDPENNAQNTNELLGKILRIDVNVPDGHSQGFVIPPGNAGLPRPEIWSLGWRNPWKFSFDAPSRGGTGAMLVADGRARGVGGDRLRTGGPQRSQLRLARARGGPSVHREHHGSIGRSRLRVRPSVGRSITGGCVYRGSAIPAMRGRYFYADYATRRVWSLNLRLNGTTGEASPSTAADLAEHTAELGGGNVLGGISSFGVDAAGELYIVSYSSGTILKVVVASPPAAPTNVRIVR